MKIPFHLPFLFPLNTDVLTYALSQHLQVNAEDSEDENLWYDVYYELRMMILYSLLQEMNDDCDFMQFVIWIGDELNKISIYF